MEFLDKSFLDVQEAKTYLNVPLLGAISKINTVESLEEQRQDQINLMLWMSGAGVFMITLTMVFCNHTKFRPKGPRAYMYNKFYGFKESPFNLTPNSRFFFPSNKHAGAFGWIWFALRSPNQRKGFVVITGEIGSGKTTVCRTLLSRLKQSTPILALLTNTHLNSKDLLMMVLEDLEIEFSNGSKSKLLSQLNSYLIDQIKQDNNVVLIIDEAQNLKPSVLEEIRMLSNLETETEKLIQIILLGQPELKQKLALSRLEQLRQRVARLFSPFTSDRNRDQGIHIASFKNSQ